MPRPWAVVASHPTPEGVMELRRRGEDEFLLLVGGRVLMSSAARRSEEALAQLGIDARRAGPSTGRPPAVLVSGLGLGCTLGAALVALPADAVVTVAELDPVVVSWCRGPLARLSGDALADPRVRVHEGDVAAWIRRAPSGSLDLVLLDLFEGPHAATQGDRDPVFGAAGLAAVRRALAPHGVLAVWGEVDDAPFTRRMAAAGFRVAAHRVPAGAGRAVHQVWIGVRGGGA